MRPPKVCVFRYLKFLLAICALVLSACRTSSDSHQKTSEINSRCRDFEAVVEAGSKPELLPGPSCEELSERYSRVYEEKETENKKILCPFLRLLKRTGLIDQEIEQNLRLSPHGGDLAPVTLIKLKEVSADIGCDSRSCVAVATTVAKNQRSDQAADSIDLARLFEAPKRSSYTDQTKDRASHDCGYTFQFADEELNDAVRETTLRRFFQLSEKKQGRISIADLVQVKKENCKRDYALYKSSGKLPFNLVDDINQTLIPDSRDRMEVALIYAYLGGIDRGFISFEDLNRFFYGQFPPNKTKMLLNFPLLGLAQDAFDGLW